MPWVPFLDSHAEGIDIFIKELEESDWLDNRLILPVNIERNFISGEGVGETEAGLLEF